MSTPKEKDGMNTIIYHFIPLIIKGSKQRNPTSFHQSNLGVTMGWGRVFLSSNPNPNPN
jgi:hypothetical protein